MKTLNFEEFAKLYCESQDQTPEGLREVLLLQVDKWKPEGFMLLRCEMLGSRWAGQRVILAYGPNNTFKTPPDHPISPRGLASDMSVVEAILPVGELVAQVGEGTPV